MNALRVIHRVTRKLGAIRHLLEKAATSQAPKDEVQATFDSELATGQLLESAAFQARAGWSRQALSKAIHAHRVFYLEVGGVRACPSFYQDLRYNRKDVEAVTKMLGNLSGGSKSLFFTTRRARSHDQNPAPGQGLVPPHGRQRRELRWKRWKTRMSNW